MTVNITPIIIKTMMIVIKVQTKICKSHFTLFPKHIKRNRVYNSNKQNNTHVPIVIPKTLKNLKSVKMLQQLTFFRADYI